MGDHLTLPTVLQRHLQNIENSFHTDMAIIHHDFITKKVSSLGFRYVVTKYMEQNSFCEADSCAPDQNIPCLLSILKGHNCVYKCLSQDPTFL